MQCGENGRAGLFRYDVKPGHGIGGHQKQFFNVTPVPGVQNIVEGIVYLKFLQMEKDDFGKIGRRTPAECTDRGAEVFGLLRKKRLMNPVGKTDGQLEQSGLFRNGRLVKTRIEGGISAVMQFHHNCPQDTAATLPGNKGRVTES